MKIAIIGDPGVGKSTYLTRWLTGDFLNDPSTNNISGNFEINTSKGMKSIRIEEVNTFHELDGLDGAILMFSLTDSKSLDQIHEYLGQIAIPVVVCGNKFDLMYHSNKKFNQIKTKRNKYLISAKSNYNYEKPFLELLRTKFGEDIKLNDYP